MCTPKGTLIAVYDVRYNSAVDLQENIDVGVSRSVDGGQTWLPMQIAMDMGEWGGRSHKENGIGDPAILVDPQTGRVWIAGLWLHGNPGKRRGGLLSLELRLKRPVSLYWLIATMMEQPGQNR